MPLGFAGAAVFSLMRMLLVRLWGDQAEFLRQARVLAAEDIQDGVGGAAGVQIGADHLCLHRPGLGSEYLADHRGRTLEADFADIFNPGTVFIPLRHGKTSRAEHVIHARETDLIATLQHGDQGRQAGLDHLHTAFRAALYSNGTFLKVQCVDSRYIGEELQAQALGNARSDLRGITVNGLLASEHQVYGVFLTNFADGLGQGEGSRQGVGAGEGAVGQEYHVVGTIGDRLAQRVFCLGRPHGQHGDSPTETVLEAQGLFDSENIEGIDDGGYALAHDGIGDRMHPDLGAVGNLFDANDNMHGVLLLPICR
ncbi:protein of unknown function [Acidithiobacillus ferrivorans]|uniref:Uncharacterized protein n=1 Tax=Acidithiobacillus ferrivorans TaxID=160808 RepID=A0ABY1MKH3_9PROT|nr:protein of unknown function [Acidithiobacillus ferrivorans]